MNRPDDLIPPHGGFRKLRSFAVALAAYDGTVIFCNRFIDRRSRTHDQMVQAARSGVQNIAEGSLASGTSKKTELKLTGVARASLGELIRDYEDYLRQNGFPIWKKDEQRVLAMRARLAGKLKKRIVSGPSALSDPPDQTDFFDEPLVSALHTLGHATPEVCANILLCLAHQASFLLHRQMQRLENDFLEKGGFTERLYRTRTKKRKMSDQSNQSD